MVKMKLIYIQSFHCPPPSHFFFEESLLLCPCIEDIVYFPQSVRYIDFVEHILKHSDLDILVHFLLNIKLLLLGEK